MDDRTNSSFPLPHFFFYTVNRLILFPSLCHSVVSMINNFLRNSFSLLPVYKLCDLTYIIITKSSIFINCWAEVMIKREGKVVLVSFCAVCLFTTFLLVFVLFLRVYVFVSVLVSPSQWDKWGPADRTFNSIRHELCTEEEEEHIDHIQQRGSLANGIAVTHFTRRWLEERGRKGS